ncbi:unnamed protein product [Chilo suppressalis]|uniref:C2H2-type domain-containing protein n=1 Tax=Chilo suppressalis TaxID=168631 RepID=A0ABN8AZF6_CHISP|nr:unnamed protein product [Chilo suppressalis]
MSLKLKGAEVKVDVVRLESQSIDEHLRSAAAVLCEILNDDNSIKNEDSSDGHESSMEEDGDGHRCQNCGKIYKSANTLNVHYRLKHPEEASQVRCNECNKSYASSLSLQKHVRYMHKYANRCDVCYRAFASIEAFQQHGEICTKVETPCPTCGKIYDSALSLRNHAKYKHPKKRTFSCDVCRRTFTSNRGLSNHMARIHPTDINCNQCNKKFSTVATLQCHFLDKHTENGERCNLCRKVFTSSRSLSRHLSKTHDIATKYSGEKYWCAQCNLNYQSVNDLIQHAMAACSPLQKKSE